MPEQRYARSRGGLFLTGLALVLVLGMALAWRYTSLDRVVEVNRLAGLARRLPAAWGLLTALGGFVVGSLLILPLNLIIVVTVVVFGAWPGGFYAYLGGVASASLTFWLGRLAGGQRVRRLFGERSERWRRVLVDRGIPAMTLMRIAPIAPFTVMNLVAGAIGIRMVDFIVGSLLGLLPGVVGLALLGDRLLAVLRDPTPPSVVILAALLLALAALCLLADRLVSRGRNKKARQPR